MSKHKHIKSALLAACILGTPSPAFGKKEKASQTELIPPPEDKPIKLPKLKFSTEKIELADLTFSVKHQAREKLNEEALADYTAIAKEAKAKGADSPFPNLKAVARGKDIFVFSGFTRGAALKKAGFEAVNVDLASNEEITDAEIFRLAVEANQGHGARLTNEDKQHNLERALKFPEYSGLSNNALSAIVGASEFFIRQHRPAVKAPDVRTNKAGKKINTKGIGKKGGAKKKVSKKAAAAAENLAANKDQSDLPLTGGSAPRQSSLNDDATRALNRICSVCDGHAGLTSKGIRTAVEEGTLKLTGADLTLWAGTSDGRVKLLAPLIVGLGWKPKQAIAHLDKEIDGSTRIDHLLNSAIATGGVTRQAQAFGEKIKDDQHSRVMVWDTRKWTVTVEAK